MGKTHTVVSTDSAQSVAQKYGLSFEELQKLNPSITRDGTLQPGQVLKLEADPVSAPTARPMATAPTYNNTKWDDTEQGKAAKGDMASAAAAVNDYAPFVYGNQSMYDSVMQKILNRGPFTYDFNGDALYQQYKDKYIKQGKMAMGDAIGQASAMTGGYGNSYAQSVGQQAYQAQLENLNDIIPELYQMALDKYNMEGQDLYNQFGMLNTDRANEYGVWMDGYDMTMDKYDIASDAYYGGADIFHTEQNTENSTKSKAFEDAVTIWQNETANDWKQAEWEEGQRRWEKENSDPETEEDPEEEDPKPEEEPEPVPDDEIFTGDRPEATDPDANIFEYRQDVVNHVVASGVPRDKTDVILTAAEWQQQRNDYLSSGQGGDYVKYCSNYSEYLSAIAQFLIEEYA